MPDSEIKPARRRGRPPKVKPADAAAPVVAAAADQAPAEQQALPEIVDLPAEPVAAPVTVEAPVPEPQSAPAPEAVAEPAPAPAVAKKKATPLAPAPTRMKPAKAVPARVTSADVRRPGFARVPAAAPAVKEMISSAVGKGPTAPKLSKGYIDMATTFSTAGAAEKFQAMFGDFNERAKTAYEKSTKFGEEMTEFTKGNVEALVASSKVAAKGAESLAQEAADYGKKSFESATTAFKSFASVKSPTELFQLQSDYAKTSFDSAVAEASKLSEAWMKLAGDVFQPISNRYAVAAEKIKAVAA